MIKNIEQFEKKINQKYQNLTGLVIEKSGETAYEQYFNEAGPDNRFHVYSVSKSIVAILIGIAIDKGFINDIHQKVVEFFPEYVVKQREKTIYHVTLKDLLTMTAPFKYRRAPYIRYFKSGDFLKFSLDLLGGKGKIGDFNYTPLVVPDILSGILQRATGQSMYEFAKRYLFEPLNIQVDDVIVFTSKEEQMAFYKANAMSVWVADGKGINTAGWGLTLCAEDMTKIGRLMINGGLWEGQQIVSSPWINQCMTKHSVWAEMNLSYGFLWWVIDEKVGIAAAIGDGGNVIYVNREKDLVVSMTALFKPGVTDRIEFIREDIEPLF